MQVEIFDADSKQFIIAEIIPVQDVFFLSHAVNICDKTSKIKKKAQKEFLDDSVVRMIVVFWCIDLRGKFELSERGKIGILEIFTEPVWYADGQKARRRNVLGPVSRNQLCVIGNFTCYG